MTRTARTISLIAAVFVIAALIAPAALAGGAFPLISNDSFEDSGTANPQLTSWKLQDKTNDKIACLDNAPGVQHGQCAFMFRGSPAENAVLTQKAGSVDMMNATLPYGAGSINLAFKYYSTSNATNFKARVVVTYTMPGNPAQLTARGGITVKGKSDDNGSPEWVGRSLETPVIVPQGATVLKTMISFKNTSTAGKFYLDEIQAVYYAG